MTRLWRIASWGALVFGVVVFASTPPADPANIYPDAVSYVQLTENLAAGNGYRIDLPGEPEGSRYPPGLPLLLVPFSLFIDIPVASILLATGLVVAVWAAGRVIAGDVAATVAVLLITLSRPLHISSGQVMADLPVTLVTVLALIALVTGRERLAGVLAGFTVWTRLAQVVIGGGLPRRSLPPFLGMLVVLGLSKVMWGWGYRDGQAEWALSHVFSVESLFNPHQAGGLPNVVAYPAMLLGLYGGVVLPGAAVAAGLAAWRRPERRFVLAAVLGALAIYIPYFYRDDRFIYPAAVLICLYAGVWCADLIRKGEPSVSEAAPVSLGSAR